MISSAEYQIIALQVSDIYGDMEIVGMGVLRQNTIEGFILPCRVFDRNFEDILLQKLQSMQDKPLVGIYRKTDKNVAFSDFYLRHGVRSHE